MVHCNECGHNGPPKTNSRRETRCEACYSLDVVAIGPVPSPPALPQEARDLRPLRPEGEGGSVPAETEPPAPGLEQVKKKPRTRRGVKP